MKNDFSSGRIDGSYERVGERNLPSVPALEWHDQEHVHAGIFANAFHTPEFLSIQKYFCAFEITKIEFAFFQGWKVGSPHKHLRFAQTFGGIAIFDSTKA